MPTDETLGQAAAVVEQFIQAGAMPGAAVLVGRRDRIVLERGLGHLSYRDDAPLVTSETIYDLASLTKVLVTTTLAMLFNERGLLDLDAPVKDHIAEFHGDGKDQVRIKDLLAHCSGLVRWTDLYKQFEGRAPDEAKREYLQAICEMPLDCPPRTQTVYSDLGFLLLGEIVERIGKEPLDILAKVCIFEPLGMSETTFRPGRSDNIAPTEEDEWRGRVVQGEVHDENAFGLGGVAPHAGVFSTARGLAPFPRMLLGVGIGGDKPLLNAGIIKRFTCRASLVSGSSRALGWDTPSDTSSCGHYFSSSSFGHTGFTGTSLWVDPEQDVFVILLTNRVYPTRDNQKIAALRPAFHDAVMTALGVTTS